MLLTFLVSRSLIMAFQVSMIEVSVSILHSSFSLGNKFFARSPSGTKGTGQWIYVEDRWVSDRGNSSSGRGRSSRGKGRGNRVRAP